MRFALGRNQQRINRLQPYGKVGVPSLQEGPAGRGKWEREAGKREEIDTGIGIGILSDLWEMKCYARSNVHKPTAGMAEDPRGRVNTGQLT